MKRKAGFEIGRRNLLMTAAASILVKWGAADARAAVMTGNVILLGDSILDNAAYVARDADVVAHLKRRLPDDWSATLLAQDGSVMAGVLGQLERLPANATHLVVSMGGNDALAAASVLTAPADSVGQALLKVWEVKERFCSAYGSTLDHVLGAGLPTAVCTIYDVRYPDRDQRQIALTALAVLNDCITRAAAQRGIPVLDLRLICDQESDFANPIEPSAQGGLKIANAIRSFAIGSPNERNRSEFFVR